MDDYWEERIDRAEGEGQRVDRDLLRALVETVRDECGAMADGGEGVGPRIQGIDTDAIIDRVRGKTAARNLAGLIGEGREIEGTVYAVPAVDEGQRQAVERELLRRVADAAWRSGVQKSDESFDAIIDRVLAEHTPASPTCHLCRKPLNDHPGGVYCPTPAESEYERGVREERERWAAQVTRILTERVCGQSWGQCCQHAAKVLEMRATEQPIRTKDAAREGE